MYILIVEDMTERIHWFEKEFAGHNMIFEKRPGHAKRFINSKKFDMIFLDHDLGDYTMMGSEEELTGYQVAKAIPYSQNAKTPCVVHSWNPDGAKNIQSFLQSAGTPVRRCMFGTFDKSILMGVK